MTIAILLLSFVSAGLWAGGQSEPSAPDELAVVATTDIIGDVLSNVMGDAGRLSVLMPTGQNPHSYEPTPSALRAVERAHLVFVNGFGLEEALLDEIEGVASGPIVPVSAGIEPLEFAGPTDSEHHDEDPHVWMDPNNVIIWVENMVDVLSDADPTNAARYRRNGDAYIARLEEIDASIREQVASIPARERKLVLDHATFSYFADEYGFETVGTIVPSTSDRADPSAQEVARLVEIIREEDVNVIFVGRTASRGLQRLAETVAAEVGRTVRIVHTLTGSLAEPGEPGDTYIGFLQYNVTQILTGLKG